MIEIKDLLGKVGDLILSGERSRDTVREVVSSVLKINIDKENIEIKNGVVYLHIKPIYKNEVLLKRDEIFSRFYELLGEKTPHDIR